MASFYLDVNLSPLLVFALQKLRHTAVHARTLRYQHAKDYEHLVFAAQRGATLLTHDRGFKQLHGAWRFWTATWGVAVQHGGILIIPDRWDVTRATVEVDAFVQVRGSLMNSAYEWQMPNRWDVP